MSRSLVQSPHLAGLLCCTMVAAAAAEQAEAKRTYNLPRGDAATMLGQFAKASGRQIIFAMEKVRGEQTGAISGEFSAREALGRMLAGTGLVAVQDDTTGAFVIKRGDRPPSSAAPRASKSEISSPSQNPPSTTTMTRNNLPALVGSWLALLLSSSNAQTIAPGATRDDDSNTIVKL